MNNHNWYLCLGAHLQNNCATHLQAQLSESEHNTAPYLFALIVIS